MASNIKRITQTAQLWIRKNRYATAVAWILLGLVVFTGFLLVILGPMAWLVAGGPVRHLHGFDQTTALNAVRQTLLTAFAGAAALVALGFTVRTYYEGYSGDRDVM